MLHHRRAFTLVELLVVIAIIGILIALLLPAVQAAREAARRSTCTNNVKQIAIAAQNYHDAIKTFPSAGINYGAVGGAPVLAYNNILNVSGFVFMLPYMEQQPLYQKYNPNVAMSDSTYNAKVPYIVGGGANAPVVYGNDIVASTQVPVFYCPSDDGVRTMNGNSAPYSVTATDPLLGARTCYEFSTSPIYEYAYPNSWQQWYAVNGYMARRKLFGMNSNANMRDVRDGTTNTVAFIETTLLTYNGNSNAWAYRDWVMYGVTLCDVPGNWPMQQEALCPSPINCWTYSTTTASFQIGRTATWGTAASLHPGGVMVGMADGSVRFISENTDWGTNAIPGVLPKLCNIADGMTIGQDF